MENHQVDPLIALLDELCTDPAHNGAKLHSLDGPTESRTSPNLQGHLKSLTPLGEPLSQASALSLAEDPLSWHLRYWLGLLSVATLHSQDVMLTAARIDHEIEQIQSLDLEIKIEIKKAWHYQLMKIADEVKRQEHLKHIDPPTLDSRSKSLLRDLDRMLEDKEEKTRKYIRQQEGTMNAWLRSGAYDTARCIFDRVVQLYQRLEEEEVMYRGVRRSDIHEEIKIYEKDSGCEIYEMDSGGEIYEMDSGGEIYEMDSGGEIYEMDSGGEIYEMDSGGEIYEMDSGGEIYEIDSGSEIYEKDSG